MDKYEGINRVEARISPSDAVRTSRKPKGRGIVKSALLRLCIGCVLAGVLVGCKFLPYPLFQKVTDSVKTIVTFDFFDEDVFPFFGSKA